MSGTLRPADIAYAALVEIGRQDLGLVIQVFDDTDGSPYIDVDGDVELSTADWDVVDKAEALMRQALGYGPVQRGCVNSVA